MPENFLQETGIFSRNKTCKHSFSPCMKREGELLVALLRAKMWLFLGWDGVNFG
jgi:hypothetical protein